MINSSSTSAVQSSNECGSSSAIWSSICCSTNTSPSSPSSSSRNQQQHHHHNNNGSQSGGNGHTLHFKILVPAVAAGAIIGKGGETIAHLQKNAGARVKMSKANDFYPGWWCRTMRRLWDAGYFLFKYRFSLLLKNVNFLLLESIIHHVLTHVFFSFNRDNGASVPHFRDDGGYIKDSRIHNGED